MQKLFPEAMIVASADRAACKALLRSGSRSFFAASHLLPQRVREPATALYAFCRLADDAIDDQHTRPGEAVPVILDRLATLARLRERMDRAYRGDPLSLPADRAFADTVQRFAIPRALPAALIEGLAWDAEGRRYETLADLHAYAARVAGTVGVMMAIIMGVRDREALARACDLGAAMQLTNIARDVGEDARAGRLYLPCAWMREAGLEPDTWLASPSFSPAVGALVQRLLAEADRLYRAGEAGIAELPFSCRPGIRAAGLLYAAIGGEVSRQAFDSIDRRAVVPNTRKLRLLLRAVLPPLRTDATRWSLRPETRFLVEAVPPIETPRRPHTIRDQIVWVLDLFERIEQRRQVQGGGISSR